MLANDKRNREKNSINSLTFTHLSLHSLFPLSKLFNMEQQSNTVESTIPAVASNDADIYRKEIIPESVFQMPPQDVVLLKRKLIDDGKLRCLCIGDNGKQLEANRSSNTVFGCNNIVKKDPNQKICGFRMNISTLKFLKQHNILAHQNEMTMPVCRKCLVCWLLLSESTKIPNYIGNLGYSCSCNPYVTRINFPIDDKAVAHDFNISNWAAGKMALYNKTYKKETSGKKEVDPTESKFYMPY